MTTQPLHTAALLNGTQNRLVIRATLKPVAEKTRFQPAGFPEIGHVIYDAPDGRKVCIVDSAASMANHLETVCVNGFDLSLVDELYGLPFVQCVHNENGKPENGETAELVVTSFSEGHRLASSYFLDGAVGNPAQKFGEKLRKEFGIQDLGKKSHPLPSDWWNVFETIFRYDPNSLVHGILFPALGIKLPRVLTATLDAFDAARVATSGVKFDKLGKTNSGQPIFAKDEETASEIRATFVIDLALIRSFGRGDKGLNAAQKQLLLGLALWKIGKLLSSSFRFRSECDLELNSLTIEDEKKEITTRNIPIQELITNAGFQEPRITQIYWKSDDLFKPAKDKDASSQNGENDGGGDESGDKNAEE
jgi:CRISPR-associated protein Csb1